MWKMEQPPADEEIDRIWQRTFRLDEERLKQHE